MARSTGGGSGQGKGMGEAEMAAMHLTAQEAKAVKDGLRPKRVSSGSDGLTALVTAVVIIAVLVIMIYFGR